MTTQSTPLPSPSLPPSHHQLEQPTHKRSHFKFKLISSIFTIIFLSCVAFFGVWNVREGDKRFANILKTSDIQDGLSIRMTISDLTVNKGANKMKVSLKFDPRGDNIAKVKEGLIPVLSKSLYVRIEDRIYEFKEKKAMKPIEHQSMFESGNIFNYPFDTYYCGMTISATYSENSTTSPRNVSIPIKISLVGALQGYRLYYTFQDLQPEKAPNHQIFLAIEATRSIVHKVFAALWFFSIWAFVFCIILMTRTFIVHDKKIQMVDISLMTYFLFSQSKVRTKSYPGEPTYGVLLDYVGTYWFIITISHLIFITAVKYLIQQWKEYKREQQILRMNEYKGME